MANTEMSINAVARRYSTIDRGRRYTVSSVGLSLEGVNVKPRAWDVQLTMTCHSAEGWILRLIRIGQRGTTGCGGPPRAFSDVLR
jgi:hypothetical protein